MIGGGIARTTDGLPLLDADGLYVRDIDAGDPATHWGSVVPKVTGGIINTLNYKNFIFNFNIDYQVGGHFFSLSEMWGNYSGLLKPTAATNDKGWNVRDNVADGGGVHVVGISAVDQRTPVDMYVDAQTYFHQFYNAQIAEPFRAQPHFCEIKRGEFRLSNPCSKMEDWQGIQRSHSFYYCQEPLVNI